MTILGERLLSPPFPRFPSWEIDGSPWSPVTRSKECVVIPFLTGIAQTMSSCPAIARRSPRVARAAHENTYRLSHRKAIVPPSECLGVKPVASHPPLFVVRHTHGTPFASRERRVRGTVRVLPPPDRENRDRRGSTYPESRPLPFPPVAVAPPSPHCGDARLSSSTDQSSQDESHAKGTHRPCVTHAAQKETRRAALIAARFEHISIIAIRLHRQRARLPIRRAGSSRDRPDRPTAQSFKSLVSSIASTGKLSLIVSARLSGCFMSVKHSDFS